MLAIVQSSDFDTIQIFNSMWKPVWVALIFAFNGFMTLSIPPQTTTLQTPCTGTEVQNTAPADARMRCVIPFVPRNPSLPLGWTRGSSSHIVNGCAFITPINNGTNNCWLVTALHILAKIVVRDPTILHDMDQIASRSSRTSATLLKQSVLSALNVYGSYYLDSPIRTTALDSDQEPTLASLFCTTRRYLHQPPRTPGRPASALACWMPHTRSFLSAFTPDATAIPSNLAGFITPVTSSQTQDSSTLHPATFTRVAQIVWQNSEEPSTPAHISTRVFECHRPGTQPAALEIDSGAKNVVDTVARAQSAAIQAGKKLTYQDVYWRCPSEGLTHERSPIAPPHHEIPNDATHPLTAE